MLIIENINVLHLYPGEVYGPVDIAIEGTKITEVGKNLSSKYPNAIKKQACGKYVSPGLVCSHNHFYSALSRGLCVAIKPSKDFAQQLINMWWLLDRALDKDITRASGLAGAMDAAMLGVTSVIDHHASPNFIEGSLDALAEGFETVGIRGILCYETSDRNGMDGTKLGVKENIRFAKEVDKKRKNGTEPLVEAAIGAHAPFTLSDETLGLLSEACKETNRGLHTHVAEDKFDAVDSRYHYGKDPIERLDSFGLLGNKTIIAHGVHLTDSEIEIINNRDSFISHQARSNMNNCVGYNTRIHEYKNPVLGTDGIGSDMIEEACFAYFKHKDAGGTKWMDSYLAMLQNGNRILERYNPGKKFGRVEAGYEADLTFWDYDPITPLVSSNVAGHIAFGMRSHMVCGTMVAGKFVIENRKPAFDAEKISAFGREQTQRMWTKMEELK